MTSNLQCKMLRPNALLKITKAFQVHKVVALLGPRQSGKTTLARTYFQSLKGQPDHYFDMENARDLIRLQDPLLALEPLDGLIVIDEIQRTPDLFQTLRVLVDQTGPQRQFLILGSASRDLLRQSSESLAGRIEYIELMPFSYDEVADVEQLWLRGGFPLSYLAPSIEQSIQWRQSYIKTFLEQDIPNLGISIPPANLHRFWMMLAHYHGQLFNASELGSALNLSGHTTQRYLDILSGTFMVRQLNPWYENIAKRQVKSKKIYFRDSGILHSLLGISDLTNLRFHPKIGASWEGFALENVIRHLGLYENECYFWRTQAQAELDLLIMRGTKRIGFEFKYSMTPKITKSMYSALQDLRLDRLLIIYPGEITFPLSKEITCVGLADLISNKSNFAF